MILMQDMQENLRACPFNKSNSKQQKKLNEKDEGRTIEVPGVREVDF